MPHKSDMRGFTLVELSVVLVIIALLIGGTLTGASLIRAAELRKVAAEYQQWVTAVNTFRDKYRALPGDFQKAAFLWGQAPSCNYNLMYGSLDLSDGTCDGNGDGKVGTIVCGTTPGSPCYEMFSFWQHLALARMIEGNYSLSSYDAENAFPLSTTGTAWLPVNLVGQAGQFPESRRNNLLLGRAIAEGSLPAEDAWSIDSKIDDGNPATGIVTTVPGAIVTDCTIRASGTGQTTAADLDAKYNVNHGGNACNLLFGF